MNRVCCIVDVNGFNINVPNADGNRFSNKFFVRELGYVPVKPDQSKPDGPKCYRFDLRNKIRLGQLSPKDRSTIKFQSEKLNGLSYNPARGEIDVMPYEDLDEIVGKIYATCKRAGADVVAFKGGDNEKNILTNLKIPYLDLQTCGCPAYDRLTNSGEKSASVYDCGHHTEFKPSKKAKCSMMEVVAYRDWYMKNYKSFSSEDSCNSNETSGASASAQPYSSSSDSDY